MQVINFLTTHFIPENTACTNRVMAFIKELKKYYRVNVICLTEKGKTVPQEHIVIDGDVNIYYIQQDWYDGKNFFKRALNEIKYLSKLVKKANKLPSDLTIATTPYMFVIPMTGFGINGTKVLDIRDLVWEYLDESGLIKKIIKNTLRSLMKRGMNHFETICVTNNYEADILFSRYGIDKVHILPNGIDQERFEQLTQIDTDPNIPLTITYVGNVGLAQNLLIFVKAAQKLTDVKFVLVGDGIEMPLIENYIRDHQLMNIELTGKIPWQELEKYYEKSSILYAQLDEKYVSAMPSKLYEYASIGLPVIYGGVGQAVSFVEQLENSIIIPPNDIDALTKAIDRIRPAAGTISLKNRELIKSKYLREESAKTMVEIVHKITKKGQEI